MKKIIRMSFPNFNSEIYYDEETYDIALIDIYSGNSEEHLRQTFYLIDYLFAIVLDSEDALYYLDLQFGGLLTCWDRSNNVPFEYWTSRDKMERLYEIHVGIFVDEKSSKINWKEVYRYFFYIEYDELSNIGLVWNKGGN